MATVLTANNGPYVFDDPGSSTTYAKLHRDPAFDESSEFFQGMNIEVTGGDRYAGTMFTLQTAQPIALGTTPLTFVQGETGGGVGPAWLTDAALDTTGFPAGSVSMTFVADVVVPDGVTAVVELRIDGLAETVGSTVIARATVVGPFAGPTIGASVAGFTRSAGMILVHLSASTSDAMQPIEVQNVRIFLGTDD
jgi:hypothetical protein